MRKYKKSGRKRCAPPLANPAPDSITAQSTGELCNTIANQGTLYMSQKIVGLTAKVNSGGDEKNQAILLPRLSACYGLVH